MPQSGFTPIELYSSGTPAAQPVAGNLVLGELALNYADGRLFYKDAGNTVRLLASTAAALGTVSSVQASGGTTGLTFTGGPITGAGTLTLGGTLAITNGGTGATAAPAARTNLGATTLGANLFTITNPSAVTFPRFNADNTVSALSAADFRAAIGAGIGTVTSVSGAGTVNGLTLTGTVTSSGNLTLGGTLSGVDLASAVTGTLPLANGGTGATAAPAARTNLGATTLGANLFTITNPSAVTFPRFNADNTVSALSAADFRAAIGAGSGVGTVTSVSGTGTVNGLTLTGTVTSSGNLTLGGTLSGVNLASAVTGTLPLANGGTGATAAPAALTNLGAAASGANTDITSLAQSTVVSASGTAASNAVGFRGLPQNSQGSGYTLALADQGRHVAITGGVTIPANSSVAFPIGTTIVIYNNSASNQTISITSDTLRLAGTATTGARTLAQRGLCTLVKVGVSEWVATGNVT